MDNECQESSLLRALLPTGITCSEWLGRTALSGLALSPSVWRLPIGVTANRVYEFSAGRSCAQHALTQLGVPNTEIGVGLDRRPQWPALLTGSITHTHGFSAAAIGVRARFDAIGIDAERVGLVSKDLWRTFLSRSEIAWLAEHPTADQPRAATLMFSAKEAFYKCQYEITAQWLEFKDIGLELIEGDFHRGCFRVHPINHVQLFEGDCGLVNVEFATDPQLVLSAMVMSSSAT